MFLLDDTRIPDGSRIIVACSGGGDSVALLHLLEAAAADRQWGLTVAHLDHALRPDSIEDARFTAGLAERLGLRYVADRREVGALRRPGESLESAARRIRYAFLQEVRETEAPGGVIVTGHTRDDQLETVALRLERGAGLRGLRSILPRREDGVVRPLLGARRDDLRRWLSDHGCEWREDASNLDRTCRRNLWRARLAALPRDRYEDLLEEAGRLASRSRECHRLLDRLAKWWTGRGGTTTLPGEIVLQRLPGDEVPELLDQVLLERGLEACGLDPAGVPRGLREALLRLREGIPASGVLQLSEGCWAERMGDGLLLSRCRGPRWEAGNGWSGGLPLPRSEEGDPILLGLPEGGGVEAAVIDRERFDRLIGDPREAGIDGGYRTIIDLTGREDGLRVRYARRGDVMRPFGMAGRRHLADLFGEERIPRLRRGRLPVLESEGTILWVGGVRTAEEARVGPDTRKAVTLQFHMSNTYRCRTTGHR